MVKLPSPSMSMTGMSGFVAVAPSAAGKLKPIAPSPPDVSHQQSFLYLYHWTAHIWCCPTPVERMPLPPVSSQSIWIVSGGASNLGNVVCHFCFCSTSSANQLEKSGTLFCPYLCGKKESIMQLWDHCTILHHMNSSDIAAPMTTRWLTSSTPKSDELPWLLADWLHQLLTVSVGWIEQHSGWWCLNKTHQWLSITTAKEKGAVLPRPLWLVWSLLQELYHRGIAICCWMSFGISTRSGPRWPDVVRKKASWIIWGMLSTFITRWSCLVMDHVTSTMGVSLSHYSKALLLLESSWHNGWLW
jgi:hypothetical protein